MYAFFEFFEVVVGDVQVCHIFGSQGSENICHIFRGLKSNSSF